MFPPDRKLIHTELTPVELEAFIQAVESGEAKHVPNSTTCFAESAACDFEWLGSIFHIAEFVEMVNYVAVKKRSDDALYKGIYQNTLTPVR